MRVINVGKFNLLTVSLLGYKLEFDHWLTADCSSSRAEHGRFIIRIWKGWKLKYKTVFKHKQR